MMLSANVKKINLLLCCSTYSLCLFFFLAVSFSCNTPESKNNLFTLLAASKTGIDFSNDLSYNEEFNPYTFRNFFNGGGVAIGDVNNDGLPDIFFCSSQQSNKLYLNKGNLKFEDITNKSGVGSDSVWSTGVTMADVNGDGWLDIYVCKSGEIKGRNRSNALYINNGPSSSGEVSFSEKAQEYGLDNKGLSTHAAFFDFDNDPPPRAEPMSCSCAARSASSLDLPAFSCR